MRRSVLILFAATLLALHASPSRADLSGSACVIDGNLIAIGGKRAYGRCVGGTPVRLFGIDAPDLDQTCTEADGRDWPCGRGAAFTLLELVRGKKIECRGNSFDAAKRMVAVCFLGDKDLNEEMVRLGWALARGSDTQAYQAIEGEASQAARGLWRGRFELPADWRRRVKPAVPDKK